MHRDHFQEEEQDHKALVTRYERMLKEEGIGFFEKQQFTNLINYYEKQHQIDKALKVLDFAFEQHPYSATFFIQKAQILMEDKREAQALELLEEAELYDSSDTEIYLTRAEIFSSFSRFDEALATLEKVKLRISQSDTDELHLAYATVYEDMEEYDKMFNALEKVLAFDPENEAALERIWLCTELAERYEDSIILHNKTIDNNAYNHVAWYNLGHAYFGTKAYEKAAEAYEFAFVIKENFHPAYTYCSEAWTELGNYKNAIKALQQGLEVFPQSFDLCMQLGKTYELIDSFRQAKNCFIKAARINPSSSIAFFHLGECYSQEERWVHALSAYESAMKNEAGNAAFTAAVAEANYQLDNNEKADELFKEALVLDTTNNELWVQYISFLIALDALDQAQEAVNIAEEYCETVEIECCKIAVLYKSLLQKEALQVLQMMVYEHDGSGKIFLQLFPDFQDEQPILEFLR